MYFILPFIGLNCKNIILLLSFSTFAYVHKYICASVRVRARGWMFFACLSANVELLKENFTLNTFQTTVTELSLISPERQ